MKLVLFFVYFFTNLLTICLCEPITTVVTAGSALIGMAAYASYGYLNCRFKECCDKPWIQFNKAKLEDSLKQHLYGQHLAEFTITRSLSGHLNRENPKKALVMSFHGLTGSGKNFVSHMIAESLYENGMKSLYVHQYIANQDFPHNEKVSLYQDRIREEITLYTKKCGQSLFIFDEVDKMPPGTIDALKPFLDYHERIDEVDYRKNIFIFLSNAGSSSIVDLALSFWSNGRDREEITMKDIEPLVTRGAFNERGGFQFSELLSSELVDLYVPFLPLEKRHVRQCIEAELNHRGIQKSKEFINNIADELIYSPKEIELFSVSGCKRIQQKINLAMEI